MTRIYLDWNVLANLRDPQAEPYIELSKRLNEISDYVLIPFTPAHIADLRNSWDDTEQGKQFVYNDLEFLSKITKNHFLAQYWKQRLVTPDIRHPRDQFDATLEDSQKTFSEMMDLEKFAQVFDDEIQRAEYLAQIRKLNEIKMPAFYGLNNSFEENGINFPIPTEPIGMLDWIKQFAGYFDKLNSNPEEYKALRKLLNQGLGIDPKVISNYGDSVVDRLDAQLPSTVLGKTFMQHVKEGNSTESTRSMNDHFDRFHMIYSQLDMFGFHPEKISKKNTYENMSQDAQHAFYAGHCDIFVTADKRTYDKAKAVYATEKIPTLVLKPEELLEKFETLLPHPEDTIEKLLLPLTVAINHGIAEGLFKEESGTIRTGFFTPTGIHRFNHAYVDFLPSGTIMLFSIIPRNYSAFTFMTEVQALVNHLCKLIGPDHFGLEIFEWNKEVDAIHNNSWTGRKWNLGRVCVGIGYGDYGIELFLQFFSEQISDDEDKNLSF